MIQLLQRQDVRVWTLVLAAASALAACRAHEPTELEVEVRSVGMDNAAHAPVVVLQDHDRKVALPIWIGPAEAQSIAMQMQGINPPRPMTHDLVKSILDGTGVEFDKVIIGELKDSTYYAHIFLHTGRKDLEIDSRPSDAIALAVRFHRPIFVATALMNGEASIDLQHEGAVGTTVTLSGVTVQNLTNELAKYFSLPTGRGVLVSVVEHDAPAGLERGDVILEIDGVAITGVGDFERKMNALDRGARARLSVQRGAERIDVQFVPRAG